MLTKDYPSDLLLLMPPRTLFSSPPSDTTHS